MIIVRILKISDQKIELMKHNTLNIDDELKF